PRTKVCHAHRAGWACCARHAHAKPWAWHTRPDPIGSMRGMSMHHPMLTRREALWQVGGGLGGIALAYLLGQDRLLADAPRPRPEFDGGLHHKAKAKRVVQLFMSG